MATAISTMPARHGRSGRRAGILLRRSLREGDLPFWDPYSGGGVPAMANLIPAFFFPPYLLLVALGNGVVLKNVYFLGLLLTAAWCTWALLRRGGLSWTSSFIGGLTFMLSGALTQTVGSFIGQTACCLPVGLLVTRWFIERATWRAAAGLAVVYGSIALASFPPLLLAVFGLSAVYAIAELAFGDEVVGVPRSVHTLRFVSGAALGIGLVAFYYLPAFATMNLAPQVTIFYRDAAFHTPVFASGLLQLFSPTLMGGVPVWLNESHPADHGWRIQLCRRSSLVASRARRRSRSPQASLGGRCRGNNRRARHHAGRDALRTVAGASGPPEHSFRQLLRDRARFSAGAPGSRGISSASPRSV